MKVQRSVILVSVIHLAVLCVLGVLSSDIEESEREYLFGGMGALFLFTAVSVLFQVACFIIVTRLARLNVWHFMGLVVKWLVSASLILLLLNAPYFAEFDFCSLVVMTVAISHVLAVWSTPSLWRLQPA